MLASLRIRRIITSNSHGFTFSHSSSSSKLHSTLATLALQQLPPPTQGAQQQHPTEPLTRSQLKTLVLNHYTHGNFTHLLQNVVASPSVLFTASPNLAARRPQNAPFHPHQFSIESLARELRENRFDVGACCVTLTPSTKNGSPLVLPNLKLKVLIEAIRMVLETVYDERFLTFCYGGRVGMGRHTAIRYLKNFVENPTWWFTVRFMPYKFEHAHVEKLCSFIELKVKDGVLIDLIKRLFECKALVIWVGIVLEGGFLRNVGCAQFC